MTGPKRDDREMDAILRSWLTEDAGPSPDRSGQVGRIMSRVDQVRQRRRIWPPFGQRAATDAAGGTEISVVPTFGHTSVLVPARALSVVVVVVLLCASLLWVASRSVEQQRVPGGWPVDPADRALFKGLVALWTGEDKDLDTLPGIYAEDAQFRLLWLDEEEVVTGPAAIVERIRELQPAEAELSLVRLEDHFSGTRKYLLTPTADISTPLTGSACVLWIEADGIRRHDCILPVSWESRESPELAMPDATMDAEREAVATAFYERTPAKGTEALKAMVSPDVRHHVLSANQVYTLEGLTEYGKVMIFGQPEVEIDVGIPAPQGELRWANISDVAGGSLCVFWASDGHITRHDCIAASMTTVPATVTEIEAPPGS